MNKHKFATIVLAATLASGTGVLTACGSADPANADAKTSTTTSTDPTTAAPTPEAPRTPSSPAELTLAPGAAGPIKVGMSKAEVTATGLFDADVASGVDGCDVHALQWAKKFSDTFDVQALKDGQVASIGVHKAGPTTASGLGIGSTYADVLADNAGAKAVESGYGQTGILIHDDATNGWIGYLFNAALKDIKQTDKVTFIELTNGTKPSLMRDGC